MVVNMVVLVFATIIISSKLDGWDSMMTMMRMLIVAIAAVMYVPPTAGRVGRPGG